MRILDFFADLSEKFDKKPLGTFFVTALILLAPTIGIRIIYDVFVPDRGQVTNPVYTYQWFQDSKKEYDILTSEMDVAKKTVDSLVYYDKYSLAKPYIKEYENKAIQRSYLAVEYNNRVSSSDSDELEKSSIKSTLNPEFEKPLEWDTNYKIIKEWKH